MQERVSLQYLRSGAEQGNDNVLMPNSIALTATSHDSEERIVDAAYSCFNRFGIAKTTMEGIARQAAISRQTVYRYFPCKNAVIDAVCCREAL
jgi:AcrR family transcriptional regulator